MTDLKRLLAEWADDFEEASLAMPTRLQKVILMTRAQECRDMLETLSDASNATKKLEALRDSISGDCYMGEDWEVETIGQVLTQLEGL